MKKLSRLILCFLLSFTMVNIPLTRSAHAQMISTRTAVEQMSRATNEQKVIEFVGRKDVQEKMVELGIDPSEAHKRVASLSDAEIRKLAGDIDNNVVGGSVGGILVIVLIVILIIYFAKRI